jgi:uncharacterized protein
MTDTRPAPLPDDITRFFWDGASVGRLLVQRCEACRRLQYPPDIICVYCQSQLLTVEQVSGQASLYSFAIVNRPFHTGFSSSVPYIVALVELSEQPGLRMLSNVVDAESADLQLDMAMEVVFRPRRDIQLPQFRPAGGPR